LFTNDSVSWLNGTKEERLCHQIESFDSVSGNLTVWVRCDLSSVEDTVLYMYYGNSLCGSMENVSGVWDSGYRMVQHLNESPANNVTGHFDSTSYDNDGTPRNFDGTSNSTTNATGQIDGCDRLDGVNDYIDCGNKASLDLTNNITVSFWLNTTQNVSGAMRILQKYADSYSIYLYSNGKIAFGDDYGFKYTNSSYNNGLWHYVVCRYDGSGTWAGLQIFVDGVEVTSVSTSGTFNGWSSSLSSHLCLGSNPAGSGNWYGGSLDEVRISEFVRDNNWINTSYTNQYNPNEYYTLGIEETSGVPPVYNYNISLKQQWNFISLPVNESINKNNITINYLGVNYSWNDAVSNGYILNFIYVWNTTYQNYENTDIIHPGQGCWIYSYHDCDIWISSNANSDNYITSLSTIWNIIGLPFNSFVFVENIDVLYNGTYYNWQDAVNNSIVLGFIYRWNTTYQNYENVNILIPGQGYWSYAYHQCILIKGSD